MNSIPARFSVSAFALMLVTSVQAQSFLYQLQNLNVSNAVAAPFGWIVTDYSHDGSGASELTSNEVATLKAGKTVLAYLSIGEAESYRFYWNPAWLGHNRPAWLGPVDPAWRGNYKVKYWDPAWQAIVYSYLDRILAQGFDGAYLDIIDGYEFWGPDGNNQNPNAPQDMVTFVKQLAAYARAKPGHANFLIIPQNGSALLTNADYLATISAIGNEDTWFNGDKRQKPAETAFVTGFLDLARATGKPVLAIDYVRKQPNIDTFYDIAEAKGYSPYASVRNLDQLVVNLHHDHATSLVVTPVEPADRADVQPDAPPTFRWTGPGGLLFHLNFAGDDAFTKVVSTASFSSTNYTPTATEWAEVMKLPTTGQLWWWVTGRDGNQVYRSSLARRLHRLHTNISTTFFWVGEPADADNGFIANDASAWDELWKVHFGGIDDPNARSTDPMHPYWPAFTPQENPF